MLKSTPWKTADVELGELPRLSNRFKIPRAHQEKPLQHVETCLGKELQESENQITQYQLKQLLIPAKPKEYIATKYLQDGLSQGGHLSSRKDTA